jgi:hypothetical protein
MVDSHGFIDIILWNSIDYLTILADESIRRIIVGVRDCSDNSFLIAVCDIVRASCLDASLVFSICSNKARHISNKVIHYSLTINYHIICSLSQF